MFVHAHTADRSLQKYETLWGTRERQTGKKFVKGDSLLFQKGRSTPCLKKFVFQKKCTSLPQALFVLYPFYLTEMSQLQSCKVLSLGELSG